MKIGCISPTLASYLCSRRCGPWVEEGEGESLPSVVRGRSGNTRRSRCLKLLLSPPCFSLLCTTSKREEDVTGLPGDLSPFLRLLLQTPCRKRRKSGDVRGKQGRGVRYSPAKANLSVLQKGQEDKWVGTGPVDGDSTNGRRGIAILPRQCRHVEEFLSLTLTLPAAAAP